MPTLPCPVCGKPFHKHRAYLLRIQHPTCSRACYNANRTGRRTKTLAETFWAKVKKTDTCWNWTGSLNAGGYGSFRFLAKVWHAHRFSWFIHHGEIPAGADVLHSCDNPACVNPGHLHLGTQRDNVREAAARKRMRYTAPKISKPIAEEIRKLNKEGRSYRELKSLYGLSIAHLSGIINRLYWK